jgi:type II secretory pathway pseudopilin PulG
MTQIHRIKTQSGFTLVELTLAVAFIGFLVLFTVLATLQVIRTYNKGLAVKEINQTSRTIVEELSRAIKSATSTTVNVTPNQATPSHSRICVGGVSYVWNVAGGNINKYSSTGNPPVTLARVDDPGGALCSLSTGTYPNVDQADALELLSNRVWVQSLTVTKDTVTNLATISLQLSTSDDPASPLLETVPGSGVRCKGRAGDQFCAVATLTTTVAMRGDE